MSSLFDLSGKTVVAIGGNSVLGSSMALGLAEHGAQVAIVGRDLEKAEKVVQDIEAAGGSAKAFRADVSLRESLEQLAKEIEQWSGGWDILLNAPGKNSPTPFFDIDMNGMILWT